MSHPCIVRTWALALAVAACGGGAVGAEEKGLDVQVLEAYAAPTAPKRRSAEVYARFVNVETDATLTGASSMVCKQVELVAADGTRLPYEAFEFKEDSEAGFREGGPHLRLVGLKHPLVRGQSFLVTLRFGPEGALALHVTAQ